MRGRGGALRQKAKPGLLVVILAMLIVSGLRTHAQVSGPLTPAKREPRPGSIQIDVEMVLANVTVTDAYGHLITDLGNKNFRLFEDDVEQEILTFSREDVPSSIGLLFDPSGSMIHKMEASPNPLAPFFQHPTPTH